MANEHDATSLLNLFLQLGYTMSNHRIEWNGNYFTGWE